MEAKEDGEVVVIRQGMSSGGRVRMGRCEKNVEKRRVGLDKRVQQLCC